MSFPRYPAYKDTSIEWQSEMPVHWQLTRTKHVCDFLVGWTPPTGNELSYTGENLWANISDLGPRVLSDTAKRISDDAIQAARISKSPKGSLLFSFKLSIGQVSIAGTDLYTNEAIATFVSSASVIIPFAYYAFPIFLTHNAAENIYGAKLLNQELIRNARFPLPPLVEQTTIALFLDRETRKIDELAAEQQRLIDLLEEKRQAVISRAVTKGLNPHAPMKPSGVQWLGDVPAHWCLTRLGHICSDINDINHEMPVGVADGVPFLSAKDLFDDGTLNFTANIKLISEEDFARLSRKICPRRGDIIYSRIGACLGKARLVQTDDRFLVSYSCCVVRVIDKIASRRFVQHLLDGEMILTEARMRTQGIGVPDLGLREIGRFPVPLPPIDEQEAISDYLDIEAEHFKTLTAESQRAIDLLLEHRAALISASVTGQIDVRSLVESTAA